jgi:hypothetical protein
MESDKPIQQPTPQAPATAAQQAAPQQPQAVLAIPRPPEQVITELRARVNAGQALTRDQVREALAALRQNRLSAAESTPAKKKSAAPTRSAAELLAGLKNATVQGTGG